MESRSSLLDDLIVRIERRDIVVGVIGLGYVGLPLAVVFAEAGFRVVGIDVNQRIVDGLNSGVSHVEDIPGSRLAPLIASGQIEATSDYAALTRCDGVSICVPTPLRKTGDPDISYIISATEQIAQFVHDGMIIVLESTTYPGTTSEVILPALEASGARAGRDFFLCFSPERVDPGREDWTTVNTPKVIGGITQACAQAGAALYGGAIDTVVPVSSTEAAEMVKLLENTFRSVNIGLANELLLMCDKLKLDAWEIIEAASTKPFGFMKFTPGPGLGGHCIPIDPLYLSWKLRSLNYTARFIELASEINTKMPEFWVAQVQNTLNAVQKPLNGSRVLVLGVAYKRDVSDVRESPALDVIQLLQDKGALVNYHDPHVARFSEHGLEMESVSDLNEALESADCVVITTDHSAYDWQTVRLKSATLVDTRHVIIDATNPKSEST